MTCELIRVDFKKGLIKSREQLGEEAPVFNPYKDEVFKSFTAGVADLAVAAHEAGGDPNSMIVIATDESAEIDWVIFDTAVISNDQAICSLKRIIAKLEAQSPEPEAV